MTEARKKDNFEKGNKKKKGLDPYQFIYLFNFIYTRVKTSGLKVNTKII